MRPEVLDYTLAVARLGGDYLAYVKMSPSPADPPEDDEPLPNDLSNEPNTYNLPDGRPIARKLRRWFGRQLRSLTGWLGKWAKRGKTGLPKSLPSLDKFTGPMADAMKPVLGKYWQDAGKKTLSGLGVAELATAWDVTDPHLAEKIERAAFAFCKSTNDTTKKSVEAARRALKDELREGLVEKGETVAELTKRVRKIYEGLNKQHAELIAQTEASRAHHAAQLQSVIESGVVSGKRLLLAANACPEICRATKAKEPVGGWPLDAVMFDDGKGHAHYSKSIHTPLHPHDRCSMEWVCDLSILGLTGGDIARLGGDGVYLGNP